MIGLATLQIVLRNFFDSGLGWADEALRLMLLWLALLGALAATRDDRHIRIDVLSRFVPGRLRDIVAAALDAFAAGVCGVIAWQSYLFVRDARAFEDTVLGDFPAWIAQSILPAAFGLIALRFAMNALVRLSDSIRGQAR